MISTSEPWHFLECSICSGESFHSDRAGTQLSTGSDPLSPHSQAHDDSIQTSWSPFSDSFLFLDIPSCTEAQKSIFFFFAAQQYHCSFASPFSSWKVGATETQPSGLPCVFPFFPLSQFSSYCLKLEMFCLTFYHFLAVFVNRSNP